MARRETDDRAERRAVELRANLMRRKAQKRNRDAASVPGAQPDEQEAREPLQASTPPEPEREDGR